jgi:hypothetical protein
MPVNLQLEPELREGRSNEFGRHPNACGQSIKRQVTSSLTPIVHNCQGMPS